MTKKLLRGRVLTFHTEPQTPDDTQAFDYIEDGALIVSDGLIEAVGTYAELQSQAAGAEVIDHRPHLLMAGFIDTHIHFPQVQVVASWAEQLLDWLENYTFPEETRYADATHAKTMAGRFYDQLIDHGTTTAMA